MRQALSNEIGTANSALGAFETDIPARLDRLPWNRFHTLLVMALGVTWVLDGLEVTIVSAVGNALLEPTTLGLRESQVGLSHTLYLFGAVGGALVFGHLADRLGRKKLFTLTLLIYLAGAALTACSWDFLSFALFRFVVGTAIGGEYAAINSAIDELIPARLRGRVDLAVNGTFWLGAIAGAGLSVPLLDPALVPEYLGWRIAFGLGAIVGSAMIVARQFVPESPRWLLTHGRADEAESVMADIEKHAADSAGGFSHLPPVGPKGLIYPGQQIGFGTIAHTLLVRYRTRAVLGLVLIASQAFFYNGVSFSYPLVLRHYFEVPDRRVGLYVLVMAVANLLGPLLLGTFFDSLGRRIMIAGTYALSAVLLTFSEVLFLRGALTAETQTLLWAATFFFASAAASAGYLTVSEIFPLEMRALAIALFYAIGTAVGGMGAPWLFGRLLESGVPSHLAGGYFFGAGLMLFAAAVEWFLGPDAEGKSLEDITPPLSAERREPSPAR